MFRPTLRSFLLDNVLSKPLLGQGFLILEKKKYFNQGNSLVWKLFLLLSSKEWRITIELVILALDWNHLGLCDHHCFKQIFSYLCTGGWRLTETFCRGWVELLVLKICSTCLSHTSFYWDYKHSWKSLFSAEFHSRKHTEYSCGSQIDNGDRFEQFVQLTLVQFRCTHVFQYMLLSLLRTIPVTVPLNDTFFWSQWTSFIDISRICQSWQL